MIDLTALCVRIIEWLEKHIVVFDKKVVYHDD